MKKQKYTPAQRAKIAAAFEAARKYLSKTQCDSNTRSEFLCCAIGLGGGDISFRDPSVYSGRMPGYEMARRVVAARIAPFGTFSAWVKDTVNRKVHKEVWNDEVDNMGRKMQKHRRAWLDMLIAEFEAPQQTST